MSFKQLNSLSSVFLSLCGFLHHDGWNSHGYSQEQAFELPVMAQPTMSGLSMLAVLHLIQNQAIYVHHLHCDIPLGAAPPVAHETSAFLTLATPTGALQV